MLGHRISVVALSLALASVSILTLPAQDAAPASVDVPQVESNGSVGAASPPVNEPAVVRDAPLIVPEDSPNFAEPDYTAPGRKRYQDAPAGTIRKLVLLVRFANHRDRPLPERSVYETILNQPGGHPEYAPWGSGRDYSLQASYNRLVIPSTVIGWIDLPHDEAWYANGKSGLGAKADRLHEAIDFAVRHVAREKLVDLRGFDANQDQYIDIVSIIHSGYGAEAGGFKAADGTLTTDRIWSHQSSMSASRVSDQDIWVSHYVVCCGLRDDHGFAPCHLGLLVHETMHLGDLEDLYDTGPRWFVRGRGIGAWSVLADWRGFETFGQTERGNAPSHPDPFSRMELGWVTPIPLEQSGRYSLRPCETHPDVFIIRDGFPEGEFILIENRQPIGFDSNLPGGTGGLAVWHVDTKKTDNSEAGYPGMLGWPENQKHYRVALLQADGKYDLERNVNSADAGDLYRDGDTIDWTTSPALRPYADRDERPEVRHRISGIASTGTTVWFRYDVERPEPAPSKSATDSASDVTAKPAPTESRTDTSASTAADSNPPQAEPVVAAPDTRPVEAKPADAKPFEAKLSGSVEGNMDHALLSGPEHRDSGADTSPDRLISVRGANLAYAEFSPAENRVISERGTLLKVTLKLDSESDVHLDASTSVTFTPDGEFMQTGIAASGSEDQLWPESVRRVSIRESGRHASVSVNCWRTLPAGVHVLHWKAELPRGLMKFDAGGTLFVRAWPTGRDQPRPQKRDSADGGSDRECRTSERTRDAEQPAGNSPAAGAPVEAGAEATGSAGRLELFNETPASAPGDEQDCGESHEGRGRT